MANQLEVRLRVKIDKNGDEYLIGSAEQIPALVDLRDTTFIVFYPPEDPDSEEENRHATLIIRKYQPRSNQFHEDRRND